MAISLPPWPANLAFIWKVPVAGALMKWIGALPVHKAEDRGDTSANDQMFASCYEGLRQGDLLHIFPEGVTRNEPSIARVRTGAARIESAAANVFLDQARLLFVWVIEEPALTVAVEQVRVVRGTVLGEGAERVVAGGVAILPLPDMSHLMGEIHRRREVERPIRGRSVPSGQGH